MDRAAFDRELEKGMDSAPSGRELASSRSPVHVLTQESEHPEYRYLRLERSAGSAFTDAADAANFSHVALANPTNSGALVVVRTITVQNTTAGTLTYSIRIGLSITEDAGAQGFLVDTRYGPTTTRAAGRILNRTQAAAAGNQWQRVTLPAGGSLVLPVNVVLHPTGFVAVAGIAVNVAIDASFQWWERAAEPGEIQGAGV